MSRSLRRPQARTALIAAVVVVAALAAVAQSALGAKHAAGGYIVRNLVSDGTIPADHVDAHLVNGWGITAGPTTPWWVADNGTDVSTLYDATGSPVPLVVTVEGGPTGTVFNGGSQFLVSDGKGHSAPARFLFASENGTIHGWNPAVPPPAPSQHAFVVASKRNENGIFKGLAISGNTLFATDFHNGRVDVFDGAFMSITSPGAFVDPTLPAGYAPFGIQAIGSDVFVSYGKQDADREDEVDGAGLGFVDRYDTAGHLLGRVASRGDLNAPWGIAWAPANFGRFSGDLLIGNFGDGHITAFRMTDAGHFVEAGQLTDRNGATLAIDGLWGIGFGNGAAAGPTTTLYFAAGPDHESHGLFGRIDAAP